MANNNNDQNILKEVREDVKEVLANVSMLCERSLHHERRLDLHRIQINAHSRFIYGMLGAGALISLVAAVAKLTNYI